MIHTQFPDLMWLKKQTETRFASRRDWAGNELKDSGWPNVILNVNTRFTYRDNIKGPLSLFTNLSGESSVEAGSKRTLIKPGFFLLTNPEEHYTLDINAKTSAETFNIHFGDHFAEQVLQSVMKSPEAILEGASACTNDRIYFHNRLQFRSDQINGIIQFLHQKRPTAMLLEEKLADLITLILREQVKFNSSDQLIPTIKKSTRNEIVRRLLDSCDFIYSNFDRDISLDDLARASCLSRFHFLRLFKIAFQKTPHQFINDVRVQRSKELLKHTSFDVRTISSAVGFTSSSSFSRMFFQQTGVYPTQYRDH
jgi:AraC family transcriptional regulator